MSKTQIKNGLAHITNADESHHSLVEDIFAISIGIILVSFGVFLLQTAQLILGGVAGIALLVAYATGWKFGLLFFVLNLPFYFFGIGGMGWRYITRTFSAVTSMSVIVPALPSFITISNIHPGLAAIAGGTMIGLGLLALFRHGAGLGGVNILVYWLQANRGMRAGYMQLGIDAIIVMAAAFIVTPQQLGWSLLSALVFNMILGVNHRPGRYVGAS